ncbi:MAG: hypothetical protein JSU03_13810 [Bacteroidetes bacterium]|nr:hypothetical protein [Bacteroidota bacterium]
MFILDMAENGQIGFQDPASPVAEGIVNFHNYIFTYLTFIAVLVS